VIAGPVLVFTVTRRVCLGLQRKDAETLEHGVETGIIRQQPDGGFTEELRPVGDEERAVLAARPAPRPRPTPTGSPHRPPPVPLASSALSPTPRSPKPQPPQRPTDMPPTPVTIG
jgi:quinol---cytochrome-c reductase cytochrome b subunit